MKKETENKSLMTRLHERLLSNPILVTLLMLIRKIDYRLEKYGSPVERLNTEKAEAEKAGDFDKLQEINKKLQDDFKVSFSEKAAILTSIIITTFRYNNTEVGHMYGRFYLYNGKHWETIDLKIINELVCSIAEKSGIKSHTVRQPQNKTILINSLASESAIIGEDNNLISINLRNGTYEINSESKSIGVLRGHNPDDRFTYVLNFDYDPMAKAPKFEAFLKQILPDRILRDIILEFIAYSLTNLNYEKTLFAYGSGANGKSTLINIIYEILGRENISSYSAPKLTDNNGYYRAKITDKLLNCCSEFGSGMVDFELLKKMISNETVDARQPFKEAFEFPVKTKFFFCLNKLPYTESVEAIRRRILLVPFEQTIPKDKQNPGLAKEICDTEKSGIFNLVISALNRLIENDGFSESDIVKDAVDSYMKDNNNVSIFMDECFYVRTEKKETLRDDLYQEYRKFCNNNGYSTCASNKFGNRLRDLGYIVERGTAGYYYVNCKVELHKNDNQVTPDPNLSVIDQLMGRVSKN